MNCPSCHQALPNGYDRCPDCAPAGLPVEGALAPDPLRPPARAKVEPLRELPGKKRRERTWRDEVRERMDRRRQAPAHASGMPLFEALPAPAEPASGETREPAPAHVQEDAAAEVVLDTPVPDTPAGGLDPAPAPQALQLDGVEPAAGPAPDPDPLGLLGDAPASPEPAAEVALHLVDEAVPKAARSARPAREPRLRRAETAAEEWPLDLGAPLSEPRPLERPAQAFERVLAATVDSGVLVGLSALVVYCSGRAAQVPLRGLLPAWPYLCGYLALLGLSYALYFSGTTGQTLGKILFGLRVVDTAGRAPGYGTALLRAVLGVLGSLALGLALVSMFFDPARRAFHDRLLRTRVISLKPAALRLS